jgi:hypothetical protein
MQLRYPSYMNNDLVGLIASLIPTPRFVNESFEVAAVMRVPSIGRGNATRNRDKSVAHF